MATNNVTGFGFATSIIASVTFPTGFVFSQASDDADAMTFPSVKFGDAAMGVNGDAIIWSKATMLPVTLSVIPGSIDDLNLLALAKANRPSQGKNSANDVITLNVVYPDASIGAFQSGVITDAPFAKSIGSNGRLKTNTYSFLFGSVT